MDIHRLSSGYWHIRGQGPCNWIQTPHWPCDEEVIRNHAFPQASEKFIRSVIKKARVVQHNDYLVALD